MTLRLISPLLLVLLMAGCSKDQDATNPPVCEEGLISVEAYAAADTVTYTELDETGLLYRILEPGSAERPTLSSEVTVNYVGSVTNGRVFDQSRNGPVTFPLSNLIKGWQLGIPLVGRGGKIRLLIPSGLGYGSQGSCRFGQCSICPDSDLVFDIELVDFAG
ncbi:FKBP-type peptidyl-prolyl cis-trans isomerase [Neolewinella litorea]|uniref:Peptidyl-prolyl cis-trans isomerase n=1 Tax=Neolewinella litorea TaxID=2562452 RepID=A0A4S4N766_9BACT|nr:FKBP-type peptidyl-prolyl cis-trans isomerase [Neolewinella litorea]THH34992.1 peptidylprolyl isomerase [Neolewinella litorea]